MAPIKKRRPLPKVPLTRDLPKPARLPDHARIQKRPLHRPPLPSPHNSSSKQKIVYISSSTPFISAVKRIHKLLGLVEKRDKQRLLRATPTTTKEDVDKEVRRLKAEIEKKGVIGERVFVRGTGKAMRKVEDLGVYFEQLVGFGVERTTGRVVAVDDIVEVVAGEEGMGRKKKQKKKKKKEEKAHETLEVVSGGEPSKASTEGFEDVSKGNLKEVSDVEAEGGVRLNSEEKAPEKDINVKANKKERKELPVTQVRHIPMLEVAVSLKLG